jgi:hypothetical protein
MIGHYLSNKAKTCYSTFFTLFQGTKHTPSKLYCYIKCIWVIWEFFIKAKGVVWWYWLPYCAAIVFLVSIVLSLILLCFFTFSELSDSKLLDAKLFVFTAILIQMRENDWEFGYVYCAKVICQVQELDTSGTSGLASLWTTNAGWSR